MLVKYILQAYAQGSSQFHMSKYVFAASGGGAKKEILDQITGVKHLHLDQFLFG